MKIYDKENTYITLELKNEEIIDEIIKHDIKRLDSELMKGNEEFRDINTDIYKNIAILGNKYLLFETRNEEKKIVDQEQLPVYQYTNLPKRDWTRDYYNNLLCLEKRYPILDVRYVKDDSDFFTNIKHRFIAIDWIYDLLFYNDNIDQIKCYFYTVYLMDLFFSRAQVELEDITRVAAACLLISQKLFSNTLHIKQLAQLFIPINYTPKELDEMVDTLKNLEIDVIKIVGWTILVPSMNLFFDLELRINDRHDMQFILLCALLVNSSLPLKYPTSVIYKLALRISSKDISKECSVLTQHAIVDFKNFGDKIFLGLKSTNIENFQEKYENIYNIYRSKLSLECRKLTRDEQSNCQERVIESREHVDYEDDRLLGQGTFGKVSTIKNSDLVVKKFIYKSKNGIDVSVLRELVMKELESPYIIGIKDIKFNRRNELQVVMPKMKRDLFTYIINLHGNNLDQQTFENKIRNCIRQILEGLTYIKSWGIAHRDLKPDNILEKDENFMISDFGMSKELYNINDNTAAVYNRNYRAPEILVYNLIGSDLATYRFNGDIWATGCIMFSMYTSNMFMHGKNALECLLMIFNIFGSPTRHRFTNLYALINQLGIKLPILERKLEYLDEFKNKYPLAYDLFLQLANPDPILRLTSEQALAHPYFNF